MSLAEEAENYPLKPMAKDPPVVAGADMVEAMASHWPYRASLGIDAALKEVERGWGTAYDPAVVEGCLKLFRKKGFSFQVKCFSSALDAFRHTSKPYAAAAARQGINHEA